MFGNSKVTNARLFAAALMAAAMAFAGAPAAQAAPSGKDCNTHKFDTDWYVVICHHWWPNGKGASDGYWEVPDIKDAEGLRIKIDIWKDGKIGPADWNNTSYFNVKFISFRAKAPAAGATRYTAWAPRLP